MAFNYPQSERQRQLQALTFAENQVLSRDLPRDTVIKSIQLRLSGAVTTTYGSGTPVADAQSSFDNIIPRVDVVVDGSETIKSVRPHLMRIQSLYTSSTLPERRHSAGASISAFPTVDQGFTYGTTGQISSVAESVFIPMEHVYCESGKGREATWLNLKGASSAEIRLTCASFSALLGFGNTAPVVYSASTLKVDIFLREAMDVPASIQFSRWKQVTKELTFSAETTDYPIDINRGNKLSGIMLFARDGAAGSATTASGKLASNLALTKLNLKLNGASDIKTTTFQALQSENRQQYRVSAPMASNVSLLDGVAHMNLIARGDITTALDLRPPMVDNAQLFVTTNSASNVSYTNPVSVTVMTEEVVEPR